MKRRETEVTEEVEETTGAGVIAPIVATATAAFTFWWLGKYSVIAISLELLLPCGVRY